MKKVVLDNGVFRKLVGAEMRSQVSGLLDQINKLIPLTLVADFGMWPEYVGLPRPPHQAPLALRDSVKSLEDLNTKLEDIFGSLIDSYRSSIQLDPIYLEIMVEDFFKKRVSKNFEEARKTAKALIFFKDQNSSGVPLTYQEISNQISLDYAVDEAFYQVRNLPVDSMDTVVSFLHQTTETLKHFVHLPLYRLVDSIVEYIWRVHDQLPDETSKAAKKTIRRAKKNLKILEPQEVGDCMYLWRAAQGLLGTDALNPVTIFTFDTQSRKRMEILVDILGSKIGGVCLLKTLKENNLLQPGEIILLCDKTYAVKDSISVSKMIDAKLI